ncbi:MAG: ATP-dependent Clp protease proteolytic subunit [Phycisphaerales bacterium]|nr:MAG: ATP-dependent Clp protease proteolytic subunit [Phycisphaerales bacterium]
MLKKAAIVWVMMLLFLLPTYAAVGAEEEPKSEEVKQDAEKKTEEPQAEEETPEAKELKRMKEELERLSTEYQLLTQRQKNALLQDELEKQRIEAEASLRKTKEQETLAELRAELARLQAESELKQAQQQRELNEVKAVVERRSSERQLRELDVADQLAELQAKVQRQAADNALLAEEVKRAQAQEESVKRVFSTQVAELKGRLELREARDELNDRVVEDIDYVRDPFVDGTLYVTDRRISLNGPIVYGTAEYVTERLHYFNNQSRELPIFIVIDSSPGGSVMQGYRIVKAIESSPAPVYVVVKSFAASMAAVITTLADHSYAYPNAIVLHHQMSSGMYGNLTQQREQLENAMEWARRLSEPVAEKMGVTVERLVELMYENNSDGDWEEFADKAKELKWVNDVVNNIREVGIRKRPTAERRSHPLFFFGEEEVDENGKRFVRLPRLQPFDHYFIYNPDGYYR